MTRGEQALKMREEGLDARTIAARLNTTTKNVNRLIYDFRHIHSQRGDPIITAARKAMEAQPAEPMGPVSLEEMWRMVERRTLERGALTLERRAGNPAYQKAWLIAAAILREMKPE